MAWFAADPTRPEQIVAAALELLATTPLERLTTRAIAAAVGVSQPALFRHFRSREAILLAVVQTIRVQLEQAALPLLTPSLEGLEVQPLAKCAALARALIGHVVRHPGLPRLLFADLALDAPELRVAVRHIVSMQRALVAELVAEAQRQKQVPDSVDPQAAATLFVAMLQGIFLQQHLDDLAPSALPERLERLLPLWLAALGPAASPVGSRPVLLEPRPAADRAPSPPQSPAGLHLLDVRPILAQGTDPLTAILAALQPLAAGSVLVVTAPFRPRPLEALLANKGHGVTVVEGQDGVFSAVVRVADRTPLLDLRDLDPPEPLERVIALVRGLSPGTTVLVQVPRAPRWLLPQLDQLSCVYAVAEIADGSALLRIQGRG